MKKFINIFLLTFLTSCAYVYHTQVSDIDNSKDTVRIPFEVMVSEVGFDLQQAGSIAKGVLRDKKAGKEIKQVTDIIGLFQMGPRTGKPVWSGDTYADGILYQIYEKCPSGKITGLTSIRETNSYPVVSGEIVKVRGYCLKKKTKPRG